LGTPQTSIGTISHRQGVWRLDTITHKDVSDGFGAVIHTDPPDGFDTIMHNTPRQMDLIPSSTNGVIGLG
jgi:hypothetical protein